MTYTESMSKIEELRDRNEAFAGTKREPIARTAATGAPSSPPKWDGSTPTT